MISVSALYGPAAADLALVEEALAQVTRTDFAPLESMLQSVLQRSGKRIRPAIALLAGGFGRYEAERQVPLAASIELLHTATLVHDDVIDTAETRRGQSTANAMFDNAASVMLGDYMFAHAAELVARTGEVAVIRLFAQTLMTMATGELNQDVSAFDTAAGNRRDYYQRIYGKTASLFATAGAGGAMMAGSQRDTVEALRRYGHDLGMAFQIVDDVLDFSGDADELGKPVGSDLLAGTLTLPIILLLENAPDDDPVAPLFAATDPAERQRRLAEILERIAHSDILKRASSIANEWADSAVAALGELSPNEHRAALEAVARFVTQRSF